MRWLLPAMACLLLLGCAAGPARSDYFILTFRQGTPDLTDEGKRALQNASEGADNGPSLVLVRGVDSTGADDAARAVIREREKAVIEALAKAGAPRAALRVENRSVGGAEFARRKDSLIIQLVFGVPKSS